MPTLFRFVVTLAVLAGIAYGAMFALAMFVVVLIAGERLAAGTQAGGIFGLVERAFLALVLLWMLIVALRLIQLRPASNPA